MVLCRSIVKPNGIVGAATEPKVGRPLAATRRVREYQLPTGILRVPVAVAAGSHGWQGFADPSWLPPGYRRDTAATVTGLGVPATGVHPLAYLRSLSQLSALGVTVADLRRAQVDVARDRPVVADLTVARARVCQHSRSFSSAARAHRILRCTDIQNKVGIRSASPAYGVKTIRRRATDELRAQVLARHHETATLDGINDLMTEAKLAGIGCVVVPARDQLEKCRAWPAQRQASGYATYLQCTR